MSKHRVFSFGLGLPDVEGLTDFSLVSDQSWLDADVIVVRSTFDEFEEDDHYHGKRTLEESDSFKIRSALANWTNKITIALNAGKTVIYLMPPFEAVNLYTGDRSYSGTGRNRQTTLHVAEFDNYKFIPLNKERHRPAFETGSAIKKTREIGPLAPLVARYEGKWRYNCHFTAESLRAALTTAAGGHCVGAYSRTGVVFLPDLDWSDEALWKDDEFGDAVPTTTGTELALRFRDEILALHRALRSGAEKTPTPGWASSDVYALPEELPLQTDLAEVRKSILDLEAQKASLEAQLEEAGDLRGLLFETGKPLERAVRKALTVLGFTVTVVDNGQSEFDAVFESSEGRFIGEVEGREKAINVAKISQLRRNVDEDFARDEVNSPATGVLFGNGYRLSDPVGRAGCFTDKVISAAPALGIVLVNTLDLFEAVRLFKQAGNDEFSKQCRRAIADSVGEVVSFPIVSGVTNQGNEA